MKQTRTLRFFLGANTARGFYSLYDELADPLAGDKVWYIKGGPGNGKSTFMHRVAAAAEKAGKAVDTFPCSGDPDSLDGIYIREDKTAYVDATSPHVREPVLPGASGRYLDLSAFYLPGLENRSEEIQRLYALYREQYERSYELLHAAELCAPEKTPGILNDGSHGRVRDEADAIVKKELGSGSGFSVRRRFLSALTCQGHLFWGESALAAGRICAVESAYGLSDVFLQRILDHCKELGCPVILCPDPITPEKPEAILVPEKSIAFISSPGGRSFPVSPWRRIRLDTLMDKQPSKECFDRFRACGMLRAGLLREAEGALRQAKTYHDELEAVYRPYVDFAGVDQLCRKHIDLCGK